VVCDGVAIRIGRVRTQSVMALSEATRERVAPQRRQCLRRLHTCVLLLVMVALVGEDCGLLHRKFSEESLLKS
jgi:hypothetical protein